MRDVAGNGACLVNPFDVTAIKEGIQKIISDVAYREELIWRGLKNVDRFKAENIARQYLEVYRVIVNG